MKKYLLSLGVVLLFAFYAVLNKQNSEYVASPATTASTPSSTGTNIAPSAGPLPDNSNNPVLSQGMTDSENEPGDDGNPTVQPKPATASQLSKSKPAATATPTTTPPPAAKPNTGTYKDGSYTGPVTDAYYGNIQVQAVIASGKLTDVQFLQYPSDRGTSVRINTQAMPILKQEAIQAQSASVNVISGATQTSEAFQQSLAAALAQAKS